MNRPEWWEPSFGGHLLLLLNGKVSLSVVLKPDTVIISNLALVDEMKLEDEYTDEYVYLEDVFTCTINLGGNEIHLRRGGKTLEEAKEHCVKCALTLGRQMLYELGEDIELTHTLNEIV